jgi:HK97 family phage major capsid protein
MSKLLELRRARKELVAKLGPLSERTDLTAAEETSFSDMKAQAEALAKQIERVEFVDGERAAIERLDPVPSRPRPEGHGPEGSARTSALQDFGYSCLAEFVADLRFEPHSDRLRAVMKAQQEMQIGSAGGVMVPTMFSGTLLAVDPQAAIFRPRAVVIPGGETPDAEYVLPALNQGAGKGVYAGVTGAWLAEGGVKPETDGSLRDVRYKPKEYAAFITVTDTLLRNWAASQATIEKLLRLHLAAAEDVAFLTGNGKGRPLGVLASPALIKVNRALANKVSYADLVAMEAALDDDAGAVWIVNRKVTPELRKMEDTEGHLIWQVSARDGTPPTLLGRPVITNVRSPALGALGDVLLADLSDYVIKDGVGPLLSASSHAKFEQNKTVIKAYLTTDGGPWLDAPIRQEDGNDYSPFVALDVPA